MLPEPSSSIYCRHCGAANDAGRAVCCACQQSLDLSEEQGRDELLRERYRIQERVGSGGFGAVYKATDTETGTTVAVKQINLRGLSPQEIIEATDGFHREVRLLSDLKHPHLPAIRDSFTDPEHWYIIMDFIEGETLETYLKQISPFFQTGLPLDEVLAIGLQLCTVLDYLHNRQPPIIFRDLKPANIMRTPARQLYLIDFGIARQFMPGKPKDTIPFGSPGYAAPEQYGRAQTTPRADIYSLGALLHQLLSGQDPAESPLHFDPLRLYGSPHLAELDALIQRMVQVDAEKRPATIAEVQQTLQRLSNAVERDAPRLWRPPEALPPPPPDGTGSYAILDDSGQVMHQPIPIYGLRTSRRQVLLRSLAIGGTVVLASAGIGGTAMICRFAPRFSGSIAPPPGSIHYSIPNYVFTRHTGAVTTLSWSPNGEYIASGSADKRVLVWRAADGALLYSFDGYTEAVAAVSWSQDGMCIASSGERDGTIQTWDALTGYDRNSFQEHQGRVLALAWTPHNSFVASGGEDGLVRLWMAGNGKSSHVHHGHTGSIRALLWLPQEYNRLASACADGTVRIWDEANFTVSVYRGHTAAVNALACSFDGTLIASASDDGTVQIWRIADGHRLYTYRGHRGKVNVVAWQPGFEVSTRIISGGDDQMVHIWDFADTSHPPTSQKYDTPIKSLAIFLGDKRIAVGCADGTVHIWTPPM